MTFIEMLQQGGYILPQYSSGQQTYQAPGTGMQALGTMMQIDQGAQQRYIQGEQLNLQRSQNTQSIINSTIQNDISRKTNERLQKQMDLSNQKLEFDMQKAILKDLDDERTKLNSMFLLKDRLEIEKEMERQGLDDASILSGMKGDLSFANYAKFDINKKAFLAKQKNGFTNMQKFGQAKDTLAKGEAYLKQANELLKTNPELLDSGAFTKFTEALNKAAEQTVGFENGTVQDIDFTSGVWPEVIGFKEFLDETALKTTIDNTAALGKQKLQNEILDSQVTANKLKNDIALQPIELATKTAGFWKTYGENSHVFKAINEIAPGTDMMNTQAVLDVISKAPEVVKQNFYTALKNDQLKDENIKDIEQGYAKALQSGDPAEIAKWEAAYKLSKQTSHSVTTDAVSGLPYVKSGENKVFMTEGITKTSGDNLKNININLPGINSNLEVETSDKKKGKVKITAGGKDYYQDVHVDETGKHYLKITDPAVLEATIGRAESFGWLGSNELVDYADEAAGDLYIGNWGGEYNAEMKAILIPTTAYGDAQINPSTSETAAPSGTNW